MPWQELSLTVHRDRLAQVEAALDEVGALSVTLLDAKDEAILEPAAGETPLWSEVVVQALFDAACDRRGVADAMHARLGGRLPEKLQWRTVEDADWTRAWMDQFQPMQFGRRTYIYPWNIQPPTDPEAVIVRLDPGLAFGTGTHATTALCLQWLDRIDLAGRVLLDFGCGSGILAIAALKLGAARAIGIDNDPQALIASADNAERNAVAARLQLCTPEQTPSIEADVVVANILAGTLVALAGRLTAHCKPDGLIALSGILDGQQDEVLAAYANDFCDLEVAQQDGWVRISGRRRHA